MNNQSRSEKALYIALAFFLGAILLLIIIMTFGA
ncbi:hypothetical protein FB2170_03405 [Maribacter sp. HTCC2170]|nr:hypothetical protein FB2170_03405 [Maribacter sp. HTCC2170]